MLSGPISRCRPAATFRSFFQIVCVLGYCLFPLCAAATLCLILPERMIWKMIPCLAAFVWSTYGVSHSYPRRFLYPPKACEPVVSPVAVRPHRAPCYWVGGVYKLEQQPAHPQYANYWAPLTRKRHVPPHSAQPQHTNHWAPRTRKRHQQEHRPQRPTERSDPTQHAKGRRGDRPGPRKGTTTRRNVTQGVIQGRISAFQILHKNFVRNLSAVFKDCCG